MSHEITACRRKWQLMKSPRSRSHRRWELGSEILNTKSHFWFGSLQNSGPKLHNVWAYVQKKKKKQGRGFLTRKQSVSQKTSVCDLAGRRKALIGQGAQLQPKWSDPNEICVNMIKSQGWCCRSADIVNIKMIRAQQFGTDEPDRFSHWDRFCVH